MRSLGGAIIVLAGTLVLVVPVLAGVRAGRGGIENVFFGIVGLILVGIGLVGWVFGDPPPSKGDP